jgi:hypothetical protein
MTKKCVTTGACLLDTSYCPTCEFFKELWPDDVIFTGTIEYPEPPLNQWREVCRWDVGPSRYPEDHAMTDHVEALRRNVWAYREAFDAALAAFEELAGEHRELWEAFMRDAEALSTPCPGDPEDYTFVRAYYRPRRSKLAAIEPDHPTVQADPAAGEIDPPQGQGEARNADGTPYIVGESGVGSAIPQSGEERSE